MSANLASRLCGHARAHWRAPAPIAESLSSSCLHSFRGHCCVARGLRHPRANNRNLSAAGLNSILIVSSQVQAVRRERKRIRGARPNEVVNASRRVHKLPLSGVRGCSYRPIAFDGHGGAVGPAPGPDCACAGSADPRAVHGITILTAPLSCMPSAESIAVSTDFGQAMV